MTRARARPRRHARWRRIEELLRVVALVVTALAALVAAMKGVGPTW
jgi:hypothetical protein